MMVVMIVFSSRRNSERLFNSTEVIPTDTDDINFLVAITSTYFMVVFKLDQLFTNFCKEVQQ